LSPVLAAVAGHDRRAYQCGSGLLRHAVVPHLRDYGGSAANLPRDQNLTGAGCSAVFRLGLYATILSLSICSVRWRLLGAESIRNNQAHYGKERGGGLAPEARHVYRKRKEKMA